LKTDQTQATTRLLGNLAKKIKLKCPSSLLFKPKIFDVLVEERRALVSRTFIVGFKSDRLTSRQKIEDKQKARKVSTFAGLQL